MIFCHRDNEYRFKRSLALFNEGVSSWNNDHLLVARFRFHRAISKCLQRAVDAGTFVRCQGESLPMVASPQGGAERSARDAKFNMFCLSNHYLEKAVRGPLVAPEVYTMMSANYRDMATLSCEPALRDSYRQKEDYFRTCAQRMATAAQADGTPVQPGEWPSAPAGP